MNFNIALNTIIYIMVFLFPGVLFRRFYYTGQFNRQFNHGNLLERFLWTLFCGVISITIFGFSFYYINTYFVLDLLHNITFDSICNIFYCLGTNTYPDEFTDGDKLIEFGVLLLSIYAFSGLSGTFCHYFVRVLGFDRNISTLKFNNDWLYLIEANKLNGIKRKKFDEYLTYLDVLTLHKDKEELYRGIYKDFIFDKENKLENIVISKSSKFIPINKDDDSTTKIVALRKLSIDRPDLYSIHNEFADKIIFKKNIEGNLLVLSMNNILNINVTYVNYFNRRNASVVTLLRILFFILLLLFAALILFPFIKIDNSYFATFGSKLTFSIFSIFELIFIFGLLKDILISTPNLKKSISESVLFILTFAIPYLAIFEYFSSLTTFLIFIGFTFITGLFIQNRSKRQNTDNTNPPDVSI